MTSTKTYSWEEIKQHKNRQDQWLVIENNVYDVTRWAYKHPGGSRMINHYAGQDASEAFRAFHNDQALVRKYLKPLHIGSVAEVTSPSKQELARIESTTEMQADFEQLRKRAHEMKLFETNYKFFLVMLGHIWLLEALAYWNMVIFGTGWLSYLVSVALYVTTQAQAGWLQHDFGHLSVFKITWLDHLCHQLTLSLTKGASPSWWNHMHYQHHSKPNVLHKDPDVRVQPLFVVGDTMPREMATSVSGGKLPYNQQHKYFFAIGPPLLFPVYFQYTTFRHAITRRCYQDMFWMFLYFGKLFYLYQGMLGWFGTLAYYFIVRMGESHWFTWVSQSNHIPMSIEHDREEPWLALQLHATCDIEHSFFNDWFTGHLNFQIEHHLFPTMPRHNYVKIQPLVRSLCQKHSIPYQVKPLWTAFRDVVRSLRHSGEIWHAAYEAHHMSSH